MAHPMTLTELISIGLEQNPQTRAAWRNAQKRAASLGIAKSGYYPQVGIVSRAIHGREFRDINGPNVTFTNIGADLTLSMMLYDFGRTDSGIQSAKMALLAANWQVDWTMQKVMVNIMEEAYSTWYELEVLEANLQTLQDAENMAYSARELNRAGLKSISDVYTTRATLAQTQMEVAQQKALVDIQKGKLAASLGFSADTPLELAPFAEVQPPPVEMVNSLIALAKEQRADLMAQRARLAESRARLNGARAEYMPKITLGGRAGADHYFHDKANPGQYQIGINMEIPLFTGFETMYQNRLALVEARVNEEEKAQLELDIALEVLTHARSVEAAQEMISFAKDNLDNASKAYTGVLEKYKAGKEGIAELSNALRQLAHARIRFSDVATRLRISIANLAYATGGLSCR